MNLNSLHILAVACSRRAVERIHSTYAMRGVPLTLATAESGSAIQDYVHSSTPELIIANADARAVSKSLLESQLPWKLPVVMVSQSRRHEVMVEAYQSGVVDFVVSDADDDHHWPTTAARAVDRFRHRQSAVSTPDSNHRFGEIVDKLEDLVAVYSLDEQAQYINPAGRRALGLEAGVNITSMDLSDIFPEWELTTLRSESIPKAIDHGLWTGEMTLFRRPGSQFVASIVVLANRSDGQPQSISIIARDIAERRKYRQLARESAMARQALSVITTREREVFDLVVQGRPNKVIAGELFLSEKTIEKHRARLKAKLKVTSNAELVRLGVMAGLP